MGAAIHPAVRERARQLYEDEGYSPEQIVKALDWEFWQDKLEVPDSKRSEPLLPKDRTAINKWAKKYGWKPWREAKKKADQKIDRDIAEGMPFAISGITDPIWHLAVIEAHRFVEALESPSMPFVEYLHGKNNGLDKSDKELIIDGMAHVSAMLHPGPRVLDRLRPVLQKELNRRRANIHWLDSLIQQENPDGSIGSLPPPFDPYYYGSGKRGFGSIVSEMQGRGPKDEAPEEG